MLYIKSTLFAKFIFQTRTSISSCEILKFKTTICVQVLDYRYITELTSFSIIWNEGGTFCIGKSVLKICNLGKV